MRRVLNCRLISLKYRALSIIYDYWQAAYIRLHTERAAYDSARLRARGRGGQIEALSEPDPDIKSGSSYTI
jgi:hypothetical protein